MLRRLYDLDRWILARVQHFAHWTQRTFGVSASAWTRVFSSMSVILAAVVDTPFRPVAVTLTSLIFLLLFGIQRIRRVHAVKVLPWHPALALSRLSNITMGAASLYIDIPRGNLWFQMLVIAFLFHGCQDLPPGESKVRKWLGKLRDSIVPAPSGAETPAQ